MGKFYKQGVSSNVGILGKGITQSEQMVIDLKGHASKIGSSDCDMSTTDIFRVASGEYKDPDDKFSRLKQFTDERYGGWDRFAERLNQTREAEAPELA